MVITKSRNGFTLIELLAVIVVLAIVILMASMAVVPRMNDARKQVFAMEANDAMNAASSFLMNNSISGDSNAKLFPVGTTVQCVSVAEMAASGDFDVDTSKYKGYVLVRKKADSSVYEYRITMTNGALLVSNKGASDIASSDVVDLGDVTVSESCPTTLTWPTE